MAKGHTASVQSVSVSSNIMVTGSSDKTIRVWDLTENKEVNCLFYFPIVLSTENCRLVLPSSNSRTFWFSHLKISY